MLRQTTALTLSLYATQLTAAPNVVTDIAPVQGIVAALTKDIADPAVIVPAGADPHDFALRPTDAAALADAQLVIWIGESMTPWLEDPINTLATNAQVVELTAIEGWGELPIREIEDGEIHDDHHDDHDEDDDHVEGHDDEEHHEHETHDHHDHGDHDPHGWFDPKVAGAWASAIATELSNLDQANSENYAANLVQFQDELAALEADLQAQLADMPAVLWPHDGYQYLENRFGLEHLGIVAAYDGEMPGPATIRNIKGMVAEHGDVCIIGDQTMTPQMADLLAEGTNATVVRITPLDGSDYVQMMRQLGDDLVGCKG